MHIIKRVLMVLAIALTQEVVLASGTLKITPWVAQTVSLTVANGNEMTAYTNIPWSLDMVALDAMKMAKGITFTGEWNRSLSQWMITSINGIQDEGYQGKNWLLCVNGHMAGVGASSYVVGPGAKIKWVFDQYSQNVCN